KEVKNGDKVLPSEAANRPGIQFSAPDKKKQYTVVMEDLDTPAPHVRHWIATNIKDPSKMQEYVPYKGPTPPDNGFHRYLFALYEQSQENQKMTPELKDPTNHRAFFDVNKFAEENKLKLVAATYM
ncbi:PEBP-like protein, partial [Backusella circina FSU 941]